MAGGHRDVDGMLANHWYAADTLARRLGLGQEVCDTIGQTFERWDGKGIPHGTKGEDLLLPARIVALADVVEVYHRTSGDDGAVSVARERSGTQFDPALVDLVAAEAPMLFEDLDVATNWRVRHPMPGIPAYGSRNLVFSAAAIWAVPSPCPGRARRTAAKPLQNQPGDSSGGRTATPIATAAPYENPSTLTGLSLTNAAMASRSSA